jgi:predicted transcriptional regulator of viral defense system
MSPDNRAAEAAIMAIAADQHGVVTRAQLFSAGLSAPAVARRLNAKRLRSLHRGVYLVGPLLPPYGRLMAAVLACGEGAVVSHWSAAGLWGLLPNQRETVPVDISVRSGDHRRPGIRTHRALSLPVEETTKRERVPVTKPARTLLDVASRVAARELERALAQALAEDRTSEVEICDVIATHVRRPGAGRLRALVGSTGAALTRSEAEERFLALIRKAQLRVPEVNVRVARGRLFLAGGAARHGGGRIRLPPVREPVRA